MLKKFHAKMGSTFGKNYGFYFFLIYTGLMFAFLSLDYKNSTMRKVELVISLFLIMYGIIWLMHSYKIAKNK